MSSAQFFDAPEPQSIVKTKLVTKYFGAWTRVMLPRATGPDRTIAYVDLFSGPGEFDDGRPSTPLWVLSHAVKDPALCARLVTVFNDINPGHVVRLRAKVNALQGIEKLIHKPRISNHDVGAKVIELLHNVSGIPALFFIDPWGYKGLTLELFGRAIKNLGCDCIFFFNYNRINAAIPNPTVTERMNDLFGRARLERLRKTLERLSPDQRREIIINGLAEALREIGGKFVLPFEFRSRHGERTSHHIIFVSKEFTGYHIMKEVMSSLSTDEAEVRSFGFAPTKSPQLRLPFDTANPYSTAALKEVLARSCAGKALTVWQVYECCTVDTPYTFRHLQDAIREMEAEGSVTVDIPACKRQKRNGVVTLAKDRIVTFPS